MGQTYFQRAACLALAVLVLALWPGSFPLDDGYITLHNARSLLAGGDQTYGSSALVGATSIVHLAVLALFMLALPAKLASFVLCLLSALAYVLGVEILARRRFQDWRVPVICFVAVFWGTVPFQLVNGLETGMAMAVVVWLLILADDRRLPFLAGLAPFVRPELAILAGLLVLRQHSLRSVIIAAVVALPWLAWIVLETGQPVPSTAQAKALFFVENSLSLSDRFKAFAFVIGYFSLLLVGVLGLIRSRIGLAALAFVVVTIATAFVIIPESVVWNDGRYLAPLVPVLILGLIEDAKTRGGILIVVAALGTVAWIPSTLSSLAYEWRVMKTEETAISRLLNALPKGSTVLIHDAGLPAWVAPDLRLVDVVGLKSPKSIDAHRRYTTDGCAWDRALDAIARENRAQYVLVLQKPFWMCVGTNLVRSGWDLREIDNNDDDSMYRLFKLEARSVPAQVPAQ